MAPSQRKLQRKLLRVVSHFRQQRQALRNDLKTLVQRGAALDRREKDLDARQRELVEREKALLEQFSTAQMKGHVSQPDPVASIGEATPSASGAGLKTMPIPEINPFLYAQARSQHQTRVDRGRESADSEFQLEFLVPLYPTPLQKARDIELYDNTVETAFDTNHARSIAATVYARYHYIDSSTLVRFVVPARLEQKIGTKTLLETMTNDCDRYQNSIMSFYLAGVKEAVQILGGLSAWEAAGSTQRLVVFGKIFDTAPLDMAVAALGQAAFAVPVREIFSDSTADHQKWQQFHRTVFQYACEDTFSLRVSQSKDMRMTCFKRWRGMIANASFDKMDLGPMDDIPVNWGSIVSRKQRAVRIASDTNFRLDTAAI